MLATLLLPAVALFSVAAAQSAVCTQSTATVNSAADATALSGCSTFSGSIVVGPNTVGDLALDGIQQVTGDIHVENAGFLTGLTALNIGSIGGTFFLNNLTVLSTLRFSSLTSVKTISWTALPALSQLTFPATVSKASSVTVSNTFLSTLDGINLNTVQTLQIDNNNRLKTFSTQVANITSSATINANGNGLDVSFPNLIWAANLTVRNIATISIPSLAVVNGSIGFYSDNMDSIYAPNLTAVGSMSSNVGSLAFVNNVKLTNISMPLLKTIGGANQIANNTNLHAISFPSLQYVGGAIDFSGNFTTPDLPALSNVKGAFNVQSQQAIECSGFDQLHSSGVIQGKPNCKSAASTVGGVGTNAGSTTSSSKGFAPTAFSFSGAAAGLGVVGGILQAVL